jgi:cytosine/adenosine deaminase-related metal-dependent hydrolase
MARPTSLLIRGGRVLTMDEGLGDLDPADVLVEDDAIAAVGPGLQAPGAEVLDATGMIVTPGFVDTHRHVWQTQLRTVAADWTLFDYFARMRSVYGSFYEPEDAYLGNHVGALEALSAGITTLVDHCHIINSPAHADQVIAGLRDAGIRGVFCYGLFPNPTQHPFAMTLDPGWRRDDARRVRREHFAASDGLLRMGLAPSEVEAMPIEAIRGELELARELDALRISCHVAMGAYDRGRRIVGQLGADGLLAEDVLLVHGSSLTDDELDAAARAGAGISATPETELQMGMGHPVTARALSRGVPISLGIDIVSNYAGDMFAQMRLQLQAERGAVHAGRTAPPRDVGLRTRQVLELATRGGARVAGLGRLVGSLTPGRQADVVLTRTDGVHMVPAVDPVAALVLYANAADVDTVLVGGRVVKRGGRLVGIDWPGLAARLTRSSDRVRAGFATAPLAEIEALAASLML